MSKGKHPRKETSKKVLLTEVDVLEEKDPILTVPDILKDRGEKYGSFYTQAFKTRKIKDAMAVWMYSYLDDYQKEALEMIVHKMGRIINGNPNYIDSWIDIAGYAQLVVNQLQKEQQQDADDSI